MLKTSRFKINKRSMNLNDHMRVNRIITKRKQNEFCVHKVWNRIMGVNDIVCTYSCVCIVILHVQSRYGLCVKQTVIKILSKLYNKWTRSKRGSGLRKRGTNGEIDYPDVSVNAFCITNHMYVLFMCGGHF